VCVCFFSFWVLIYLLTIGQNFLIEVEGWVLVA
jgi:hypothetical protein